MGLQTGVLKQQFSTVFKHKRLLFKMSSFYSFLTIPLPLKCKVIYQFTGSLWLLNHKTLSLVDNFPEIVTLIKVPK